VTVSNGARALEAVLESKFDIVLLDINLPGGYDGLEICARLRKDPATANMAIIMISAMSDDEHRKRAFDAGATSFFAKPFSPTSLLKELDAIRAKLE
jgi:DNA-binding response OmpR family regulator